MTASVIEETVMDASRVELLSLANEFNSLGATFFAMYITVVSGYLISTYLVGAQLTRRQLILVNSLFSLSALYFLWSMMSMWVAALGIYQRAGQGDGWTLNICLTYGFNTLLSISMLVGIFASLQFTQDIRRRERERENQG